MVEKGGRWYYINKIGRIVVDLGDEIKEIINSIIDLLDLIVKKENYCLINKIGK